MGHDDCLEGRVVTNEPCWQRQHADDQKERVHGLVNVRTVVHINSITAAPGNLEGGICRAILWIGIGKTDASEPVHQLLDRTLLFRGKRKGS